MVRRRASSAAWMVVSLASAAAKAAIIQRSVFQVVQAVTGLVSGIMMAQLERHPGFQLACGLLIPVVRGS
jgi:hypothetical protein